MEPTYETIAIDGGRVTVCFTDTHAGFALCNPTDTKRFNGRKGRKIALGRLKKHPSAYDPKAFGLEQPTKEFWELYIRSGAASIRPHRRTGRYANWLKITYPGNTL